MRPAVVVQADYRHGILDDTVLVQITTTRHGIPGTEVQLATMQSAEIGLALSPLIVAR